MGCMYMYVYMYVCIHRVIRACDEDQSSVIKVDDSVTFSLTEMHSAVHRGQYDIENDILMVR